MEKEGVLHRPPAAVIKLSHLSLAGHGRWNNGPQNVHVLIPRTWECVTLQGKRDFAHVVKDLETGRLSWSIQWAPNVFTRVLISERGRQGGQSQKEIEDIMLLP